MKRISPRFWLLLLGLFSLFLALGSDRPVRAQDETDTGWPREISNHEQITIYEPQVEKWVGNQLEERAAVSVQTPASSQPTYGVIWINARTEVDKANHMVTLFDIHFPRASFPSDPAKTKTYLSLLSKNSDSLIRKIALDRLQANLALTRAEARKKAPALHDAPPQIIYSNRPAILVLLDGDPVLRDSGVSGFLRVINTRALIVLDQDKGTYYFYMGDRWMESPGTIRLRGPWSAARNPPAQLEKIKQAAVDQKTADLLDEPGSRLMQDLSKQVVPEVFVATGPAELLQSSGKPQLEPVSGTGLLYVKNSDDTIFVDPSDQSYYILVSGRWYRSKSLSGPWLYVAANRLPKDFARIPENHPKGNALASVAGTPQAQEAGIANEIPQTATINRDQAKLTVDYDGPAEFKPIEGTPLFYAQNSRVPVIEVDRQSYYAVQDGIWFAATSPQGPWVVATEVPAVVYTIPPGSPMYYVTFVRIYGYTPEVVYDGYTPGYLGSYDSPDGVVVFGTGYWYPDWVGTYWVGPPFTYGFGWYWGVGFGWGLYAGAPFFPWWGPWWGARWRPGTPGVGGLAVAHVPLTGFNVSHLNVYRTWNTGNATVVRNTWDRNAIATREFTTSHGFASPSHPNNLYAGPNGHVYRYNAGNWEEHGPSGWQHSSPQGNELDQNRIARGIGSDRWDNFRGGPEASEEAGRAGFGAPPSHGSENPPSGGGFHGGSGGFHGGGGGFRGGGGGRH